MARRQAPYITLKKKEKKNGTSAANEMTALPLSFLSQK
jgi:hypothetical protein